MTAERFSGELLAEELFLPLEDNQVLQKRSSTRSLSGLSFSSKDESSDKVYDLEGLSRKVSDLENSRASAYGRNDTNHNLGDSHVSGFLLQGAQGSCRTSLLFNMALKRVRRIQDGVAVIICQKEKLLSHPPIRVNDSLPESQVEHFMKRVVFKYVESHEDLITYLGNMHVSDATVHTLVIDDLHLLCQSTLQNDENSISHPVLSEQRATIVSALGLVLALMQNACRAYAQRLGKNEVVFGASVSATNESRWNFARYSTPWIPSLNQFNLSPRAYHSHGRKAFALRHLKTNGNIDGQDLFLIELNSEGTREARLSIQRPHQKSP